jgi:hypothetical protein
MASSAPTTDIMASQMAARRRLILWMCMLHNHTKTRRFVVCKALSRSWKLSNEDTKGRRRRKVGREGGEERRRRGEEEEKHRGIYRGNKTGFTYCQFDFSLHVRQS